MVPQLGKLLEPGRIGTLTLANRVVMPPMVTEFAEEGGTVGERIKDYYEARARGRPSLIIVEAACVHTPEGLDFERQLRIDDDRYIAGLAELAGAITRHDVRVAIQLHHVGLAARTDVTGQQPVGPSATTMKGYASPHIFTVAEIQQTELYYAEAAVRAREAGFDGVEIHAAHHYLVAQFLSRLWNNREDEYGGALPNRARFLCEVLRATKELAGRDYPVWFRINGYEKGLPNGMTVEDARQIAVLGEAAGADAVHVSAWGAGRYALETNPSDPGHILPAATAIKAALKVPVIAVGRLEPKLAEAALRDNRADFIGMGRGFLADSRLMEKIAEGRIEDAAPCISCWTCVAGNLVVGEATGLRCSVNAALGRERQFEPVAAVKPKRIMVVGGGPAGMEAARVAALRGHRVTLYEKEPALGGQLLMAERAWKKDRFQLLNHYLRGQLDKLGVQVVLGVDVTAKTIEEARPDAVVIATGVQALRPNIEGITRPEVVTAIDLLRGKAAAGKRVVVIGGERVGLKTAEYLASLGKKVTVTRRGRFMGAKLGPVVRRPLIDQLKDLGVTLLPGVQYVGITGDGVSIVNAEGEPQVLEADTVVLAAGASPRADLLAEARRLIPEVLVIGDCVMPRDLVSAVSEGYLAGLRL